jgi:RNA polymerase sigma-70 factor (ECF subfamily)
VTRRAAVGSEKRSYFSRSRTTREGVEGLAAEGLRRHYDLVFRYVRRRSRSQSDAEDITQEVFADAAAGLARQAALTEQQTLAWLYTVAKRRLVDEARQSTRRIDPVDVPLDLAPTPESEYGPGVAAGIAQALRELPAPQREVVLMKVFDGRSFAEIAERLGITQAAAKMRCVRGLEAVRAMLRHEGIHP